MTQELIDVKNSILEGRYQNALMILVFSNHYFNFKSTVKILQNSNATLIFKSIIYFHPTSDTYIITTLL
jgi:hypothetical protein